MSMIYCDNAFTSYPKPPDVIDAITRFINPLDQWKKDISGLSHSLDISRDVKDALITILELKTFEKFFFTANLSYALDLAFRIFLKKGCHVITTSMEHDAVLCPLMTLKKMGIINLSIVDVDKNGILSKERFSEAITEDTTMIVLAHCSNVIGRPTDISWLKDIKKDAILLVDSAQTAGALPFDELTDVVDIIAFTGHKALLGPTGIGGLIMNDSAFKQLMRNREDFNKDSNCSIYPITGHEMITECFQGMPNTLGLTGLIASLNFIHQQGIVNISTHLKKLAQDLYANIKEIEEVDILGPDDIKELILPIIPFTVKGINSGRVCQFLKENFGIIAASGSYQAEKAMETLCAPLDGTIRISLGYFNTQRDIKKITEALKSIIKKSRVKS